MNRGYVKLWRKTIDSRIFKDPNLLKIWVWCLMKANHKGQWVEMATGKGVIEVWVDPGQFIFGRDSAAKELGMKPSSVRNRIKKLENLQNLSSKSDRQYSIITIIKWDIYQPVEEKKDSEVDNQRTGKGQPKDTNKNDKNDKKKDIVDSDESTGGEVYHTYKKRKLSGKRLESFKRFWEAFDYKDGKAKAADSWFDIPTLTESFVDEIVSAAKAEAARRPGLIANGKTPKMAQGWITERRWEDETYKKEPGRKPQPSLQEQIS